MVGGNAQAANAADGFSLVGAIGSTIGDAGTIWVPRHDAILTVREPFTTVLSVRRGIGEGWYLGAWAELSRASAVGSLNTSGEFVLLAGGVLLGRELVRSDRWGIEMSPGPPRLYGQRQRVAT